MLNKCCLWLTGFSGAGKTTIAKALCKRLEELGEGGGFEHLDGDVVRASFCKDLGFSKADRNENIKRISYVAAYLSTSRIVICTFISPYKAAREKAKTLCNNYVEIFVDCPIEVCEERDVKGLYAKVRAGEIKGFTGIDDPYEVPEDPDVRLCTDQMSVDECVDLIIQYLNEH